MELSADEARRIGLRAQGLLGAPGSPRRRAGDAAPSRRGAARHDLGARALARARRLRAARARSAATPSRRRTGPAGAARSSTGRTRRASCRSSTGRGSRFAAPRARAPRGGAGTTCPAGVRDEILARLRGRGPLMTGDLGGAKASAGVVGLVAREGRGRAAAGHRRRRLRRASRLAARLRPARAGDRAGAAGASSLGDDECLAALVARRGARARRRDGRRPRRAPPPHAGPGARRDRGGGAGGGRASTAGTRRRGPIRRALATPAARPAPHDAAVAV